MHKHNLISDKPFWNRGRFLAVCAALAAAGLILTIAGIAMGGLVTGIQLNGDGFHVSAPLLYKKSSPYIEKEEELEPFDSIEANVDYADIQIVYSGEIYAASYFIENGTEFQCTVEDGKLTVGQKRSPTLFTWFSFGNTNISSAKNYYITIYVPLDTKLKTVDIQTSSGNLECSGLQAEVLHAASDYGDVRLDSVQAQELEADVESGSLTLAQVDSSTCSIQNSYGNVTLEDVSINKNAAFTLESGDMQLQNVFVNNFALNSSYGNVTGETVQFQNVTAVMESGDCDIEDASLLGHWDMKASYGDVKLKLASLLADYNYFLKTEYGEISMNGEDVGDTFHTLLQDTDKKKSIEIDSESGNIEILGD